MIPYEAKNIREAWNLHRRLIKKIIDYFLDFFDASPSGLWFEAKSRSISQDEIMIEVVIGGKPFSSYELRALVDFVSDDDHLELKMTPLGITIYATIRLVGDEE